MPEQPPAVVRVSAEQAGATAGEVLKAAGVRDAAVARVRGELRDLAHVVAEGDDVEAVPYGSQEGRAVLRHSCAHVLAQAVQHLFPGTRLGIGPPVRDGFYYDFLPERPFTPEDLTAIERRMSDIVRQRQRFSRRVVTDEDARAELADEPFKLELLELKGGARDDDGSSVEVGAGELTVYDNLVGEELVWKDLCRGPHLPTTRDIPAFRLMRTAAAYWRGDQANPQLQRVYGTAWESKDALKAHLTMLEEAEKRDHRRLGAELDLFSFPDEIGSGLAVFHPGGGVVRRVMEDYSRRRHEQAGYEFVSSPHITKGRLFELSGHLDWYAEGMYPPMHLDAELGPDGQVRKPGQDYYLKPMNCPMHNLIFAARGRSYRELPLRMFEFGTVYRYEKSGVVHGLTRARGFTQDDAHIYCTREQMRDELRSLLQFVLDLLRDYGLSDFYLELSTKDPDKHVGSDAAWEEATRTLEEVAAESGLELVPDPGGAAFYGPKISVQARDAIGRTWQMSTIQLDFNLPERFALEYQAADGSRQRPVMIHRALFGSVERFFAVLLEHYAGAFPAWLAPVQVVGIPVHSDYDGYLQGLAARLRAAGVRVEVDTSDDRMQKKIRNAQRQKVPFMLIAGEDDVAKDAVSFRYRDGTQDNGVPVDDAVARLVEAVRPGGGQGAAVTIGDLPEPLTEEQDGVGIRDAFSRLYTPHRMAYIKGEGKPAGDRCPFCTIPGLPDAEGLVVARGEQCFAVLNLYPYNSGHLMVVPYRHVSGYEELSEQEATELALMTQRAIRACRHASGAQGFNVGMNLGSIAGAGIAAHLHQHVVPRWGGDTNFMPVVGATRVLPQLLPETRELLARSWAQV